MKERPIALSLALGLLISVAAPAVMAAAVAPDAPRARVEVVYAAIAKAAAEADTQDQLVTSMTAAVEDLIDYDAFAARTLKTSWPGLSAADKARFKTQFKQLIINTYARRFKPKSTFGVSYRGDTRYRMSKVPAMATVKTTVKTSKIAADVDYKFNQGALVGPDKRWFVYDIIIDEVSMALNWRRPFEKIIAQEGFDALIAKIESKTKR